ncbi:MAG: substrate-binding domain-containing protein, partial [Anaerolineae bacterium]
MRRILFFSLMVAALLLAACGGSEPTPAPQVVRETVEVVVTQEVEKEVVVTQEVEVVVTQEVETEVIREVTVLALPEVNPLEVTGDIVTAGSSTVFPLSEAMAERFQDEGYADNITIDSIGSGAGFERFCVEGETDISNASRGIKDSEVESCQSIGRDPIEFRVGTDAL